MVGALGIMIKVGRPQHPPEAPEAPEDVGQPSIHSARRPCAMPGSTPSKRQPNPFGQRRPCWDGSLTSLATPDMNLDVLDVGKTCWTCLTCNTCFVFLDVFGTCVHISSL